MHKEVSRSLINDMEAKRRAQPQPDEAGAFDGAARSAAGPAPPGALVAGEASSSVGEF